MNESAEDGGLLLENLAKKINSEFPFQVLKRGNSKIVVQSNISGLYPYISFETIINSFYESQGFKVLKEHTDFLITNGMINSRLIISQSQEQRNQYIFTFS